MFIETKELLESLQPFTEPYFYVVTKNEVSKKFTVYYINSINYENNLITLNIELGLKKRDFKTEEFKTILNNSIEENPEKILSLKLPDGKIIYNFNSWELKNPNENSLCIIITLFAEQIEIFKKILNPFIDHGIKINYILTTVPLLKLKHKTEELYYVIKHCLSGIESEKLKDVFVDFSFMVTSDKIVGISLKKVNDDPRIIADEDEAANWIFLGALNINDLYDYIHSGYELNELYKDFFTILKEFPIRSYYQSEMFQGTYLEKADIIPSILKDFKQHYKLHNELLNPIEFEEKLLDNLIYVIRNYFTNNSNFVEDYLNILIKIFESRN